VTAPTWGLTPFWAAALASPDTPADVKAHARANIDAGRSPATGADGYTDHLVLWWSFCQGFVGGVAGDPLAWVMDPDVKVKPYAALIVALRKAAV
jgi:hypothetical protein